MTRIVTIVENRGRYGRCDDCGAALKNEYHCDDGHCYGSECVKRHLHPTEWEWLTLKASQDLRSLERIDHIVSLAQRLSQPLRLDWFSDGSIAIREIGAGREGNAVFHRLVDLGWRKERFPEAVCVMPGQRAFWLIPPRS